MFCRVYTPGGAWYIISRGKNVLAYYIAGSNSKRLNPKLDPTKALNRLLNTFCSRIEKIILIQSSRNRDPYFIFWISLDANMLYALTKTKYMNEAMSVLGWYYRLYISITQESTNWVRSQYTKI